MGIRVLDMIGSEGVAVVAGPDSGDVDPAVRARLRRDDPDRYAAFHSARARCRFERSRAAAYLALAAVRRPEARLAPSRTGHRPRVCGDGLQPVWLSISHTDGLVVAATSLVGPLGVDVERHDRDLVSLGIADRFCAGSELLALRRADPDLRPHLALDLWLAKEALSKAAGRGLALDFRRVAVPVSGGSVRHPALHHCGHGDHRICLALVPAPQTRRPHDPELSHDLVSR